MLAGALEIQIFAQLARLQSDMNQAKGMVANTMAGIERAAASAKMALGAVGAGLSMAALAGQVRQAVDQLAKLDDMAQKTGSSVENLSRLSKVAAMTGQEFGAVDAALIKLSKGMATVDSETNKVNNALRAIGVSAKDSAGKLRDPSQVMVDISTNLQKYRDGANKAALVNDLFGKSGAELLPYLNDINEHVHKFGGESAASAASAAKLLDMLGLMRVRAGELFSSFAVDLLPALTRIGEAFENSETSSLSFGGASKAVVVVMETLIVLGSEVAYVFSQTAIEISGLYKQLVALSEVSFSKIRKDGWTAAFADFNKIGDDMKKAAKVAREEHDKFIAAVLGGQGKIDQALKLKPKTDGQSLNYQSGQEKTAVAAKISDYQRLTQEIAKLSAEEQKRIALGRELTDGEKRQIDLMAGLVSGTLKMTEKEIPLAKALLDTFAAQQKVRIESEKLKKTREEIAGIVTSAETANAEYLERLEFENSLIGKSALQVAQLTAAYQSNLTLKRQFADIDKATKGLTDPAAIAKLKAESNARIEAIKAEARAKIEAKYIADVRETIKVRSDPAITQEMGARLMPEEVARRTAAAKAEHDAALAKIADLDVIHGRIKIEEELKAKINKAELEAHDIELARATGASIMADEAAEKIAKYGADNVAYAEAALAISRDTGLQEYRGFEERNKQLQARVEFFTAEAEAKKSALGVSANQLEFDKANILLQQQLYQIQLDAGDLDEQKKLGLAHQIKMQDELIGFLARKRNLDMSQVGSGEELVEINKELLRLKKAIDGLDVGAEAKAKAQADAAKTQLEAAQKLADTAKKTMNANMVQQFESDFHNGMLRLLEQGKTSWSAMMKGFANSFKVNVVDFMYKQLAKPYIFKFIASFAGLVGANGVASAANTAADAALAGTSSTSWMSILKGGYDALSGGFKAFGDLVSSGLSKAGMSATNAGMAGTAASYLGAGMAGVTIGTFIAGDKTLLGMNGMTTSVLGAALSAALLPGLGPIGLFIGGIAGGALNALFGRGPKEYGATTVRGGFSGEGFAGNMVTPWTQKGGVFRSNKSGEDITPLEEQAQQFLNSFVGKSGASFARLITLSGDAARSVEGWNFEINRALTTEEDMTKLFGDMADSMGTFVIPELEKFRAKGENLADTAVRMGDEYVITESIFRMMGFTVAATGIASLGMRDSLIQLMGGIQQTSATMDSYYKNFYTADEQQANSLRQVNDAFKVLGLVAPTTREGFRALAETLVKDTTPAGQALFASVMALNPAFAAVTQSTEDMAAAMVQSAKDIADAQNAIIDAAKKTLDAAFAGVQRAVQAERDSITKQYTESLSVVNASISKLTSLSSALKSSVAGLNPLGRGQAQAEIKTALMLAGMGVFPTAESMARALQSVAQPSEQLFRTFEDYKRDQILTSNDIEALGKLTDDQLSVEERTLKTLEDMQAGEMSRLDGILKGAQDQIDAINGVNNSVLSVIDAIFAMNAALANFQMQSITTSAMQTGMGITNVNGMLAFSGGDASAAASSSTGYSASEILARRLGQRAAIDSVASPISSPVIATPPSAFNINDMSTWTQQQKDDWRKGGKWPSFAVGTNYVPQDMLAQIHQGEAIIPKAYNRNNDSTNGQLVAAIEGLQKEVVQLRKDNLAQLTAIAITNNKMEKVISRSETKGTADNPLVTEAA